MHARRRRPTSAAAWATRCDFTHTSGINADVTIALHRHPIGEWVCLESGSWVNPHGVGLAETRLHDQNGSIGRALQTLLLEPIAERPVPGVRTEIRG